MQSKNLSLMQQWRMAERGISVYVVDDLVILDCQKD